MPNILIINGSPRKKGNTAYMGEFLSGKIMQKHFGVEKIFLYDRKFEACIDCRACKNGELSCTVQDDMQYIYPKIEKADVLVFSSPIYWLGPTGKMKSLIDRLRPYYGNKKLKGKFVILLMAANEGFKDSDLTEEMFKRTCKILDLDMLGSITAKAYDIGDVAEQNNLKFKISELVKQIEIN